MGRFLLTFVRHGETEYNRLGLLQGQIDIPLNKLGLKQADALGRYLARESFDRIYSSDLSRCVQTAEGLMRNSLVPRPSMIKDVRLRERCFGEKEGRPRKEANERAKTGNATSEPQGVETPKQVIDRGLAFLYEMCRDVHKENSHNAAFLGTTATLTCEDEEERDKDAAFEIVFAQDGDNVGSQQTLAEKTSSGTVNDQGGTVNDQVGATSTPISQVEEMPGNMVNTTQSVVSEVAAKMCGDNATQIAALDNSLTGTAPSNPVGNTASDSVHGTGAELSSGVSPTSEHSIFQSQITGMNSLPNGCPHIFVSAHGYILRAMFGSLRKMYKMDIPGGAPRMRSGCPNTGMSTFVVTTDGDGEIEDMECYFIYKTHHLDCLNSECDLSG